MGYERYSEAPEEILLKLAPKDEEAYEELISRYLPSIRRIAAIYKNSPADRDDLVSEGILGLMAAVRTYSPDKGASFSTYAGSCAANRMRNALKKAQRINGRESPMDENGSAEEPGASPEKIAIDREFLREVFAGIPAVLTEHERNVLGLYLAGESYQNIAKALGADKKSVDNALARVRRKLRARFY